MGAPRVIIHALSCASTFLVPEATGRPVPIQGQSRGSALAPASRNAKRRQPSFAPSCSVTPDIGARRLPGRPKARCSGGNIRPAPLTSMVLPQYDAARPCEAHHGISTPMLPFRPGTYFRAVNPTQNGFAFKCKQRPLVIEICRRGSAVALPITRMGRLTTVHPVRSSSLALLSEQTLSFPPDGRTYVPN